MLPPPREFEFLKFIDGFTQHLRSIRDPRKALAHALRGSRELFRATWGCIAVAEAGESRARLLFSVPRDAAWDLEVLFDDDETGRLEPERAQAQRQDDAGRDGEDVPPDPPRHAERHN